MLEQRRAQEKGYITLREAADISNYSADYIGQLIRAGKIEGEQVYSSVAWVTTEESLRAYTEATNKSKHEHLQSTSIAQTVENFGIYFLYAIIALLSVLILVVFYIFAVSIDQAIEQRVFDSSTREFEVARAISLYE